MSMFVPFALVFKKRQPLVYVMILADSMRQTGYLPIAGGICSTFSYL